MMPAAAGARPVEALPAAALDGPLLCNFNQFYKLVPAVWAAWMALLRAVPRARLWLLSWNDAGKRSLLAKADEAGVAPDRILFSTFFEERWHVAAKGTCDLFLDAHPCAPAPPPPGRERAAACWRDATPRSGFVTP